MRTVTSNNGHGLTMDDVRDWLGDWDWYRYTRLVNGETSGEKYRKGQAFMIVLSRDDNSKLTATLADPFYKDTDEAILDALEFLLTF